MAVRSGTTASEATLREVAKLNRIAWVILLLMGASLVPIIVTANDVDSPEYVAARGLTVLIFGLALVGVVVWIVRYRRIRALVRADNAAADAVADGLVRPSPDPSDD